MSPADKRPGLDASPDLETPAKDEEPAKTYWASEKGLEEGWSDCT